MAEKFFWGANGEYGPFTAQQDGWPNAGEVLRYYRRQKKLQAEEVAKRYSELIGEQVTARWILKMEQQNKVPTDITRRRALVQILEIPPILLGLASLGQATYERTPNTNKPSVPMLLKPASNRHFYL